VSVVEPVVILVAKPVFVPVGMVKAGELCLAANYNSSAAFLFA